MTVRELIRILQKHVNDNGSSSITFTDHLAPPPVLVGDQPVYVNDQSSTWEKVYGVHFEKGLGCVIEVASRNTVMD